jgi:hypothetical protein
MLDVRRLPLSLARIRPKSTLDVLRIPKSTLDARRL